VIQTSCRPCVCRTALFTVVCSVAHACRNRRALPGWCLTCGCLCSGCRWASLTGGLLVVGDDVAATSLGIALRGLCDAVVLTAESVSPLLACTTGPAAQRHARVVRCAVSDMTALTASVAASMDGRDGVLRDVAPAADVMTALLTTGAAVMRDFAAAISASTFFAVGGQRARPSSPPFSCMATPTS
jgi:hypothetical protein